MEKSSIPDHSAIVREIKSKIDDLMSDASSSTAGESTSPALASTSQHQSVSRLLSGLRAIRNLINRSSLNQIVLDRQLRQQQQPLTQSVQSKSSVHAIRKNIEIVVNRLQDGETDEVISFEKTKKINNKRKKSFIKGKDRARSPPLAQSS